MMRVLLVNEYFSDNVGDQAIAKGMSEVFSSKGYLVEREGFSRRQHEEASADVGGVRRGFIKKLSSSVLLKSAYWVLMNLLRVIFVACRFKGVVVIGGGQLILANSSFAIAMFTWVLVLKLLGRRVIILSVGVGEEFGFFEKLLYKFSFSMADDILAREEKGISRLKSEFSVDARFCPDMAYALVGPERSVREHKVCTVCITDYNVHARYASEMCTPVLSREQYWKEWKRCIDKYVSLGYLINFSWTTESDWYETDSFLKNTSLDIEHSLFNAPVTLDDVMGVFSNSDVVIAGRMHGLILAQICGCIVVPWIVSKKIQIFVSEYLPFDAEYWNKKVFSAVDELAF